MSNASRPASFDAFSQLPCHCGIPSVLLPRLIPSVPRPTLRSHPVRVRLIPLSAGRFLLSAVPARAPARRAALEGVRPCASTGHPPTARMLIGRFFCKKTRTTQRAAGLRGAGINNDDWNS